MNTQTEIKNCPIGADRLREMWATHGPELDIKCTEIERGQIRKIWDTMPGHTCFMDAFWRLFQAKCCPFVVMLKADFDTVCKVTFNPVHHKAGAVGYHAAKETAEKHAAKNNQFYGNSLYYVEQVN